MLSFSESDSRRDVLVTGIGLVTPLGCSATETWNSLLRGERAGKNLSPGDVDHFDALHEIAGLRLIGAPVDHVEVQRRLLASSLLNVADPSMKSAWLSEPLLEMSLLALDEALSEAKISLPLLNADRSMVVFGNSKGGLRTAEELSRRIHCRPKVLVTAAGSPTAADSHAEIVDTQNSIGDLWQFAFQPDSVTRAISALTGATAGSSCPVAACATGLISVLQGAAMIHAGLCDVCIVGSADAALRASVLASFHRLRVTSRHDDGATACRPFDESRNGFIIGEGAAVMILESRRHAQARGVNGIAQVKVGGWLNDPTGITQIDTSGEVVAEVLNRTVRKFSLTPQTICLHGTGTESNDLAEARGVHTVFDDAAPVSFGVKGALGHLLGAAGSVETALTLLALKHRQIPATMNLSNVDPRCRIPLSTESQSMPSLHRAAKLSLGFGGHVACGIFDAV